MSSATWILDGTNIFTGKRPSATLNLVLGLNNGGGNYGPHVVFPDGHEKIYAIIGAWTKDLDGDPTFPAHKGYLATIIHESQSLFRQPSRGRALDGFRLGESCF